MAPARRASTVIRVVSAMAAVALLASGCGPTGDDATSSDTPAEQGRMLADDATLDGAMRHLRAFQDIADRNGGHRALGSPGYRQSIEYAEQVLRDAGYTPIRQEFTTAVWAASKVELSAAGTSVDAAALSSSGATEGAVTARAVVTRTPGCTADELHRVTAGTIAVVQRGTCTFGDKYRAAAAKGVVALVITDDRPGDWEGGSLGLDDSASIAVVGVAQDAPIAEGQDLTLTVDAKTEKTPTWNLLAETAEGDADHV